MSFEKYCPFCGSERWQIEGDGFNEPEQGGCDSCGFQYYQGNKNQIARYAERLRKLPPEERLGWRGMKAKNALRCRAIIEKYAAKARREARLREM